MYQILAEGVIDLAESEWLNFYDKKTAHIELVYDDDEVWAGIFVESIDDYGWRADKNVDPDEAEADFHDYLNHLKGTNGATMKDFEEFFKPKGWDIDWLC